MRTLAIVALGAICASAVYLLRVSRIETASASQPTTAGEEVGVAPAAVDIQKELAPGLPPGARTVVEPSSELQPGHGEPAALATSPQGAEELWEEQYKDATYGQIMDEMMALQVGVAVDIARYMDEEFAAGRYVVESAWDGGPYTSPEDSGAAEINSVRLEDGFALRVDMHPENHPDVYVRQRKLKFLLSRSVELKQRYDDMVNAEMSKR